MPRATSVPKSWASSGVDVHLNLDLATRPRQGLEESLREAIRGGRLPVGTRLPSSRALAADYRRPARDLPRVTAIALVVVGVLYLGVAAVSLLVLGPATGSTEAPLAELLAIGIGGEVRVLTAVAAVLLTFGAMNAYFAGAAKLGAALGRDGALPPWFARGSSAGEVPRRSLAVVSGMASAALAVVAVAGVGPRASVLLTTGSLVLVYVLGTAAAIRLLPRDTWSRRAAIVAFAAVVVLLLMTGLYLLWTLAIALAAVAYERRRRARSLSDADDPRTHAERAILEREYQR